MNSSIAKIWFALVSAYTLVIFILVVTLPSSPPRNTAVITQIIPSKRFEDPVIAYQVLEKLDLFKPTIIHAEEELKSIEKFYMKPFLGLIFDEDYCKKHRAYFVDNTEAFMQEMVFLSDHNPTSFIRKKIFPAAGNIIQPELGRHMSNKEWSSHIHKMRPEINIFYGDVVMYYNLDIGKHFGCLSQMSNYIPGHSLMYRKDEIIKAFSDYAKRFEDRPQCFNPDKFFPRSWLLTEEDQCLEFFQKFNSPKYQELKAKKNIVYMKKIGAGVHGGRGVFPVDNEEETSIRKLYKNGELCGEIDNNFLMQDFIGNPLLIHGHKFDFRIFLLIASVNPIIAYYGDGYLRASLKPYNASSTDKTVFLTNPQLVDGVFDKEANTDAYQGMSKQELLELQSWMFDQLQDYLLEKGVISDPNWLDNKLRPEFQKALIHLVRMSQHSFVPSSQVYGFFGVDFMLDDELNLWFIEANSKPGFTAYLKKKQDLIFKTWLDQFEIVFNLLRSRMKRVVAFINLMMKNNQIIKREDGSIEIKNYEQTRREFDMITKNYFDEEYQVSKNNGFIKIIDENYMGEERYMGFLKKECF